MYKSKRLYPYRSSFSNVFMKMVIIKRITITMILILLKEEPSHPLLIHCFPRSPVLTWPLRIYISCIYIRPLGRFGINLLLCIWFDYLLVTYHLNSKGQPFKPDDGLPSYGSLRFGAVPLDLANLSDLRYSLTPSLCWPCDKRWPFAFCCQLGTIFDHHSALSNWNLCSCLNVAKVD